MITILTGPIGGGKTTYLNEVIPVLRARGIAVDGYLSRRIMNGRITMGYDLLDLRTGELRPFLRRVHHPEADGPGPFDMDSEGLAAAATIIERGRPAALFVLDELGRLELQGKGVWPAVRPVLAEKRREILAVIREGLLDEYRALFEALKLPCSVVPLPESKEPDVLLDVLLKGRT